MVVAVPGRVNLIGEHIDYYGLPVLPIALQRRVRVAFEPRDDALICATSEGYGRRQFLWTQDLQPVMAGDWENYLRAAARAIAGKWDVGRGIDATIASDLPPAAGLSSSSALLVAIALSLLRANGRTASFAELMEILPDGEQFVGTRGGGMDHAAALASRVGCASLIEFAPLTVWHVPVPADWSFLVAHSLTTAEKSGAVREHYNRVRAAGPTSAHAIGEARRVREAVVALEKGDAAAFGALMLASHDSLRDDLQVSCPALDQLVNAAMTSGAMGARLTGAGFGGCAVVLCRKASLPELRRGLIARFYAGRPKFDERMHLIVAEPGDGALAATNLV